MQAMMLAFARKTRGGAASLRQRIGEDLDRRCYRGLCVQWHKKVSRSPGWMKVSSPDEYGALNIEWEPKYDVLTVRAISRKGRKPYALLGLFVEYLLVKHRSRISSISIPVQ